jgi:hypothetical protein
LSSEWQKYWVIWKTRSDINEVKSVLVGRLLKDVGGTTADSECYIAGVKLEKGNTATEWSPNPLDTEYDNELATTVYDSSGYGRNGTIDGNVTYDKSLIEGNYSLKFKNDGYLRMNLSNNFYPTGSLINELTLSCWFKMSEEESSLTESSRNLINFDGNSFVRYRLNVNMK